LGVLITYYSEGPFLRECLDTLLSGPDKPDEILIYDDASPDPAERYVRGGDPVRIIRGKYNIGVGRARNELMKVSQSDFIHFQDADDFFDPLWCQKVRSALARGGIGVVLNNVSVVNGDNTDTLEKAIYDFRELSPARDLQLFFLLSSKPTLVAMTTFLRESGLATGGFLPREVIGIAEDFEFHMRLFALSLKFEVVDDCLVIRRIHANSLTRDEKTGVRPEVYGSRIKILHLVKRSLPVGYYRYLPDLCHKKGVSLYRSGWHHEARLAFRIAEREGGASYRDRSAVYRFIAKTFGPEPVEWLVLFYSRSFFKNWRVKIRSMVKNGSSAPHG